MVCVQFWQSCCSAAQISKRPPGRFDFGRQLLMDEAAETSGRDIHEVAEAVAPHANEINRSCLFGAQDIYVVVDACRQSNCSRKIICRAERYDAHADRAHLTGRRDSIYDFIQRAVASRRNNVITSSTNRVARITFSFAGALG